MRSATQVRSLTLTLFTSALALSAILYGGYAQAEVVYSGTNFRIEESMPTDLGTGLEAVTLTAIGQDPVSPYNPNGFDSGTGSNVGIWTASNALHQLWEFGVISTPTLTLSYSGSIDQNLDTHFLISTGQYASVSNPPSETKEQGGDFGNSLTGTFSITSTVHPTWDFAYLVVPVGTQVNLNFTIAGVRGVNNVDVASEVVNTSFTVTPEPGTITMLCAGAAVLAVYLFRRRKS